MMQNKYIFGLTGGSGCGKTTVGEEFKKLGADIVDCDIIARNITKKGSKCLFELAEAFGGDIIDEAGNLKRKALGDIVFSDKNKLQMLNDITHKYICDDCLKMIEQSKRSIIGIDGAVIIGSAVEKLCKSMVSVVSGNEIRQKRIMLRDEITEKQASERINSQKSNTFYIENSDFVIYNNSTREEVEASVREVWEKLVQKSEEIKNRDF